MENHPIHFFVRRLFLVLILSASNTYVFALGSDNDAADRSSATVFLKAGGGMHVYKSELLDDNDTGTTINYSLGIFAGEERDVGVIFARETDTTAFKRTSSTMTQSWQDIIIRYRLGSFHLSAIIGSLAMQAKSTDADIDLDIVGTGYGGNFGWVFGFLRNNAWYFDLTSVSISDARELNQTDVSIGSRLDIDTGVSFFVTKEFFDVVFGYRMRTFSVTTDSGYAEAQNTTYLAFRMNAFL